MSEQSQESPIWSIWSKVKSTTTELESQLGTYIKAAPSNEEIKKKLYEWGNTAGEYLDKADDRIGEMEKSAGGYLKELGGEFKQYIAADQPKGQDTGSTLFDADIPASRLEAQLLALHNRYALFEVDEEIPDSEPKQADQIPQLLEKYKDLEPLKEKLVPSKLTENQFWNRYFELRQQIIDQDNKRKELLSKHNPDDIEGWGSSDEDSKKRTKGTEDTKETTKPSKATEKHDSESEDDWE